MVNILWIDTETTGLDPEKNRLLQIAARLDVAPDKEGRTPAPIYFETGILQSMYDDCLTPTFEVSLGALKVNRKTMLFSSKTHQDDEMNSVGRFANWLLEMQRKYGDYVLGGHAVDFDVRFIKAALKRIGIVGLDELVGHRRIDTTSIALFLKDAGRLGVEKGSLEEVAKCLSIPTLGHHDAKFDVDLTAAVYYAMKEIVKV